MADLNNPLRTLALEKAKLQIKLDTLKAAKGDYTIVIDHLVESIREYDWAMNILSGHQIPSKKPETLKTETLKT